MKIVLVVLDVLSIGYGIFSFVGVVIGFTFGGHTAERAAIFLGATGSLMVVMVLFLHYAFASASAVIPSNRRHLTRIALALMLIGGAVTLATQDFEVQKWGVLTSCVGIAASIAVLFEWSYEKLGQRLT